MAQSRLPASKTFPAARFREAIRGVWEMGATPDEQRVTFCWEPTTTYTGAVDSTGIAFDPNTRPVVTQKRSISVPCGVEYVSAQGDDSRFGELVNSRVQITVFDQEYKLVGDANFIMLEDEKYNYHHDEAPYGLFQVGLHVMIFEAENDI